jgi:predicted transcriptional regulator
MGNSDSSSNSMGAFFGFVQEHAQLQQNINQATGAAIRTAREGAGISQTELARWMHVSGPYISQVESGKKSVSSTQLERIYNALNAVQRGTSSE